MAAAAPPKQLGKYRPIRKLGAGGMGVVYLAEDVELGRTVALKVLPKRDDMAPNLIDRFRSEARAAARLNHPGIVTVYDSGETDKALYIALEYVDGKDVDRLLKSRERLPAKRATDLVRQIGEALVHLHEKGIVHRDIKPSNIMVRRDGSAVLADLGLARAVEEEAEGGITRAGYTVGTVDYMAPEQAKNSRNADVRSDLYSLGCSWFHMLTGQIPYPGESLTSKLSAHDNDPIPDPRSLHADIPDSYTAVLQRAMAKDPRDRYATPQEFLDDLELAHKRRGSVSSDLLKDLADSDQDDDVAVALAAQERAAEALYAGDDDEEDEAVPVRRKPRKGRKQTAAGGAARPKRAPGEVRVDGGEEEDDGDSSPRRRKPVGDPKAYNRGLDPVLIRNLLIGVMLLVVLGGVGVLAAKFSGVFGDPSRVTRENPKEVKADPAAPPPAEKSAAAATLVREATDAARETAGGRGVAPPPADPGAAPAWVAPLADRSWTGSDTVVVSGAADPNPAGDARASSLTAALATLPAAGGTVTLRGVGPFTLPRFDLPTGAKVRIRAEGRSAPVVNAVPLPPGESGWLRAWGGTIELDGLHVVLPESAGGSVAPALIDSIGASAVIRGGSITARGDAPAIAVRSAGADGAVNRTLLDAATLRGNALTAVSLPSQPSDLFAVDCLLACGDGPAIASPPASVPPPPPTPLRRPQPGGGMIHFASRRTRTAPSTEAGRNARFVNCTGVFRGAVVVVAPDGDGPLAVTLAGCAFGATPGTDGAALVSPPDAEVEWTVKKGLLAGLSLPDGLDAPRRPDGWTGEPIAAFASIEPTRFAPAELLKSDAPTPPWATPAPADAARAAAATRLPRPVESWAKRFPDGPTVQTAGALFDDELAKTHPDGTTVVLTGGRRLRLGPVRLNGRSLRIVGQAEDGRTPVLAAQFGAGGTPLFAIGDGRLELVNLTLESRSDSTGGGPLVAAEGPGAELVLRRCELRAGSGDAPAVRVRGGSAVLTGSLLVGEGPRGLVVVDRGGADLDRCGLVTPGPAVLFGPDGTGAVGLTRCAIAAGGPIFDASAGDGNAVAVTDRCLFAPPPPGGPSRVTLAAGEPAVWGVANAFATAFNPPPKLGDGPPGPNGGERDARTGASAVLLQSPRLPDWKAVTADDLRPVPGSAALTDGLGAGTAVGPSPDLSAPGAGGGSRGSRPVRPTPRGTPGPNF